MLYVQGSVKVLATDDSANSFHEIEYRCFKRVNIVMVLKHINAMFYRSPTKSTLKTMQSALLSIAIYECLLNPGLKPNPTPCYPISTSVVWNKIIKPKPQFLFQLNLQTSQMSPIN